MAKFLYIISGGSMPETEADAAAMTQAMIGWYTQLGSAVVDPGNPFTPSAMTVASNGTVRDGSAGAMATGYMIFAADSMSAAVKMAQGSPVLQGGSEITVYEIHPMM